MGSHTLSFRVCWNKIIWSKPVWCREPLGRFHAQSSHFITLNQKGLHTQPCNASTYNPCEHLRCYGAETRYMATKTFLPLGAAWQATIDRGLNGRSIQFDSWIQWAKQQTRRLGKQSVRFYCWFVLFFLILDDWFVWPAFIFGELPLLCFHVDWFLYLASLLYLTEGCLAWCVYIMKSKVKAAKWSS